jgi:prolyl-tRNA synthetase
VIVLALNTASDIVKKLADDAYRKLIKSGFDALYDDRDISAGIKFKDADLVGVPIKVVIGEKNAKTGMVEVKSRKTGKVDLIKSEDLVAHLKSILK